MWTASFHGLGSWTEENRRKQAVTNNPRSLLPEADTRWAAASCSCRHHRPAMVDCIPKLWNKAKFSFHKLLLSCIETEMWKVIRHSLQCFMYGRIPKSRTLLSHRPNPNQSIPATVQPSLCVFIWHPLLRDYHFPNSHWTDFYLTQHVCA